MYNSITEEHIRQIPPIGTIDIARLPQELTRIFAEIVDLRNALNKGELNISNELVQRLAMLRTLASNLETLILIADYRDQRSVAFVGATAHYLLLQVNQVLPGIGLKYNFEHDTIPEIVSAIILFLIGNSPADAAEVASKMIPNLNNSDTSLISRQLMTAVGYLAMGGLRQMLSIEPVEQNYDSEEEEALDYLWSLLLNGIRQMAAILLGDVVNQVDYFGEALQLAVFNQDLPIGGKEASVFAGPYHLARLFNKLQEDLLTRGIVNVPAPTNVGTSDWDAVLKVIAKDRPYLWENHFDAIKTDFLESGISAVLTFPTGAGKSTLAELKIAATLLSGRSIIYLVPTHALEEQVARNLNSLFSQFPENLLFELEIDLEYTELGDGELPPVSVMTPERCLTTLSVNPQSFHNIGLVVFDEFHLIHGKDNKLERRSVDAMFCLLLLFTEAAQADYMLISAMVQNGQDVADWLAEVLDRKCISFNSSWKPTRQLQGCLVYPEDEIRALETFLGEAVKRKKTITWPKAITDQLIAEPYNFFSLKNTWDSTSSRDYYISKLLDHQVHLGVNEQNKLTSNRNQIAGDFAIHYANMGFKTLVFVDNPIFAKSTADRIAAKMDTPDLSAADFQRSHENLVTRLATELGDIKHSFINLSDKVAVHHGNLLPVERRLNELYFKQKNGIKVIVATATLAQGINLPAEVVIMAGDDRYDEQTGRMEKIQPYEILNTAGRAGRAGSAAQGIVLIVPGVPVTFENFKLSDRWWNLRNTVFSKGDQCLKINDPMEYFLDSLQVEGISLNDQQKNILFRLQEDVESDEATKVFFKKSFAGFLAAKANQQAGFEEKVKFLIEKKRELKDEIQAPNWVDIVSIKMAIEPAIIVALGDYIEETGQEKVLEFNIYDAVAWLMDWIALDQDRIITLFPMPVIQDNLLSVLGFVGKQKTFQNLISGWNGLTPLINLYISGATYIEIENAIGGRHDQFLSKARKFVLKVIPTLSYVFSLFALTLREKMIAEGLSPNDIPYSLKTIASSIREGLDTSEKLRYKYANPQIPRVQVHIDAIL